MKQGEQKKKNERFDLEVIKVEIAKCLKLTLTED